LLYLKGEEKDGKIDILVGRKSADDRKGRIHE